jgi:phosphatidylglycerophosphate synthase
METYFSSADPFVISRLWRAAGPAVFVGLYFLIGLVAYGVRCSIYGRFRDAEIEARGSSVLLGNWARTYFAWVMRPVWSFLQSADIPPNAVTSVSVLLAIAAGIAVGLGQFSLGGWLYLCSGACDFLDGRLARITGKSSASGAALDSILDRYSEAAMLIGLAWYYRESWVLLPVLAFLAGSFLVPYVRARGEGLGLHLKVGLMQRPERVVVMGVAVAFSPLSEIWNPASDGGQPFHGLTVLAILLLAVSTQFTAAHRLVAVTRALDERANPNLKRPTMARYARDVLIGGIALASEFIVVILLVNDWPMTPVLATATGVIFGSGLHAALLRASSPIGSWSVAHHAMVTMGGVLLSVGGMMILLLIPGLDYRLAWVLIRLATLAAWNGPMRS